MKKTFSFSLEVDIEVDGKTPDDEVIVSSLIEALNEGFPTVFLDSEELDCILFVNAWIYEETPNAEFTGGQLYRPSCGMTG